jgi:hypothetical protein
MSPASWQDAEPLVMEKFGRLESRHDKTDDRIEKLLESVNALTLEFTKFKVKNTVLWAILASAVSATVAYFIN